MAYFWSWVCRQSTSSLKNMLLCMHVQASQQFLKQGKCFPLLHPSHSRAEESPRFLVFLTPYCLLINIPFQYESKKNQTQWATSLRPLGFIYSISSYCFFRYSRRGAYPLKECQKYQLSIYCFHFPKLELKDF